jgi:hypothetical protein
MIPTFILRIFWNPFTLSSIIVLLGYSVSVKAQNICARVSIEITQELSFERQAFEARMTVENQLPQKLTDLSARILFYDEGRRPLAVAYLGQPNPPSSALFFSRSET